MKRLLPLIFLALFSQNIEAVSKNKLNVCKPTHSYTNNYEPEVFFKGNNLLRKAGQTELYCGEKILVKLEILDKNCVPISDAKIYLWQVGCDGKYPYNPLRNKIDKNLINTKTGSSFVGSGIATTNNLGSARFITIYPLSNHKQGFINIRVEHADYGTFQTKIFPKREMMIEEGNYEVIEAKVVTPWENIHRRY